MKMMKLALLGGAALAVTTAAARADELADLKAQIESMNARIAQLESAPAVPAGYQLLSISKGTQIAAPDLTISAHEAAEYGDRATVISVLPTADAPASTVITWSGFARAAVRYTNTEVDDGDFVVVQFDDVTGSAAIIGTGDIDGDDSYDLDVLARGEIKVVGVTDTAVGEVGALAKIRGNFNGAGFRIGGNTSTPGGSTIALFQEAWGWWAMTPELTLGGGYTGSLGNVSYGLDGACNCYYTDNSNVTFDPGDTTQIRLTYGSGPFKMAIALEDASNYGNYVNYDQLGVAGEIRYSGDIFNGEISAFYRGAQDDNFIGLREGDPYWQVAAGMAFGMGDVGVISAAAGFGSFYGQDYWLASILGSVNLSDEIHAEIAYGYRDNEDDGSSDTNTVLAGIYWDPVPQLTIGLEGEWINYSDYSTTTDVSDYVDPDGTGPLSSPTPVGFTDVEFADYGETNQWTVDIVSVFRF